MPGKGADLYAIAKAVAEKRAEVGDDFNRSELHRELKAGGVKVSARVESFCRAVATLLATERGKA